MAYTVDVQILCGRYDRLEISTSDFVERCLQLIAGAIGCSRAGIWLFDSLGEGRVLRCLGIYDRINDVMTTAPDETSEQVGAYLEALESEGHVVAPQAQTHRATAGLFGERLAANGVQSLMASAFSLNGRLFGAFTCTQVEQPMRWTTAQLTTLKRMGARISLSLAGASKADLSTLPMPL
jgi:GAF domain-containing protein